MNIINDKWLYVRYLDNRVEQVSVRQAFIDAEKIKNIETPTFHNSKIFIYDVPVMQLLSVIAMSAYFKPENNFIAKDPDLFDMTESWNTDIILSYLDKWYDRFDIFDEKYPFLQDIRLKPLADLENTDVSKYISMFSVIAPGSNNTVFEHTSVEETNIEKFKPSIDEVVYIILYEACLGICPNGANYPSKSINGKTSFFVMNVGNNLKETIIANCPSLVDSVIEGMYDRPVWELDNRTDIDKFDITTIHKNILLCSFFPCMPFYVGYDNGEVKDMVLAKRKDTIGDTCILDNIFRDTLIDETYIGINPWSIRGITKDKDTGELKYYNKPWTPDVKILNLCIEATQKTSNMESCVILEKATGNNKSLIYYRELDGMMTNVLSFGRYELPQYVFEKLYIPENHEKAIKFQQILNKIRNGFNIMSNSVSTLSINNIKTYFYSYAENYFLHTFITNIENDDVIKNAVDKLSNVAISKVRELQEMCNNPMTFVENYSKFCGMINKMSKETTDNA